MSQFTDTSGDPLSLVPVEIDEGETSSTFVARVPCAAGRFLKAFPDSGITITARRSGTGDAFANIASAPVDLSPLAPAIVSFDFRISAGSVAASSPLQAVVKIV